MVQFSSPIILFYYSAPTVARPIVWIEVDDLDLTDILTQPSQHTNLSPRKLIALNAKVMFSLQIIPLTRFFTLGLGSTKIAHSEARGHR